MRRTSERFPRYAIGDDGTVLRTADDALMTPQPRGGYLRVKLTGTCGFRHWVPVHILVLEVFVGPRPSTRHHGAHKDGNRRNNTLQNLTWKLPKDNEADKKLHGTHAVRRRPMRRVSPAAKRAILRRVARGQSFTRVAAALGLHRHSVSRIVSRFANRSD